jgi:hypothetical protein
VKPVISQNHLTRRIETGDIEVLEVDLAGREPEEKTYHPVDDGEGSIEISEFNRGNRIRNKMIQFAYEFR